ncbi:MAG: GTP-binding protein [Candidatus Thermoplasmatota archaeon]|nr:GTP-binding protein [Euryarchaeota archaeon]MBU4032861.1 GTP-binding protein [Candidatus Thermoplasmatota archaeon]MBU4071490.1 GTP-binding protein [Candidatus Thermoplasmatota archaeon]MBU4144096.1 GTP-binding protein [Candidatus Thermoplasmatota archaeon]MBU4590988.1 GTP-binding protein [Candidatus Thermoplasmatota archaeon]
MLERKLKVKLCMVGDSAVGKTSLIKKFVLDVFDDAYITTIGTKITKRTVKLKEGEKEVAMDMMIWDIMGQISFRSLLQDAYFYGTHGILAVVDSTRPDTLESIHDWVKSVRQVVGDVPMIFVANKCDLESKITKEMLTKELGRYDCKFLYVSAKTGENVAEAFKALGDAIIEKYFPEMA